MAGPTGCPERALTVPRDSHILKCNHIDLLLLSREAEGPAR